MSTGCKPEVDHVFGDSLREENELFRRVLMDVTHRYSVVEAFRDFAYIDEMNVDLVNSQYVSYILTRVLKRKSVIALSKEEAHQRAVKRSAAKRERLAEAAKKAEQAQQSLGEQ